MGRKGGKHKKERSHKKKKKEKKKNKERKHKHHRKTSSSSDSDTSRNSSSCEVDGKTKYSMKKSSNQIQDEIGWCDLFSERHTMSRKKSDPKKERHILDEPGQSARELNPYWKDGGNGLPPADEDTSIKPERNYDVKSLKKLLQQSKDTANVTGIPLAKIIKEKWGPLEKLQEIIEVSENEKARRSIQSSISNQCETRNETIMESTSKKLNFIKPGEGSHTDFMRTHNQNWRKKTEKEYKVVELVANENESLKERDKEICGNEKKTVLTPDELNALAAKKIKAEIMGNKALAEKLERQIQDAKKDRMEHIAGGGMKPEREKEEVILVSQGILDKMRKSREENAHGAPHSSNKRRLETHKQNERLRYFMDDDKHSLKSMFEREKLGATDESNELFLKLAKRGKYRGNDDDNELDDDFLDRVRRSDYEKMEIDNERNRVINEAKTKHKSLNNCRWCLDGSNFEKHLIISIGTKCYLRLPSEKSLTNGHCLIVPVHHETCATLLDEDVSKEMNSYKHQLCRMFEDAGQDVVFFENARSFNRFPHMVLHCVPMDKEIGDLAPIYFKKAILESETEWSNNRKLIDLRNKDVRRSVPKGLPYFAVDFGRDGGFAHVIEDEKLFPRNFAEEIIGGMLDLDPVNWRKGRKESLECQKEKVKEFMRRWAKYERKQCKPASDSSDSG